ncbi:hypothetical protein BU23DRAFT_596729 [Bimuria novae-zelandiae CBS 107.79]|uniref:Peptidase A1 domain-containing protein n=1 Tax=Bimuria novae-zelandiae CBS 107.79 TaxID=1447943 RepID=A0A6A5VHP7_9PLEO|nr:hypothetical protein BU23DRAFT_596729 [Bimuria novae-zelandiae CBS 107.79]
MFSSSSQRRTRIHGPSRQHLHRRCELSRRQTSNVASSIYPSSSSVTTDQIATVQQSLDTLGGRVCMTSITLASQPYTIIIDTGSSDTWVASSSFVCKQDMAVRQTIGVVERGWWMGDCISSGLVGLAYATLASNYRDLNYTIVPFSLFEAHSLPSMFTLALSRPHPSSPHGGGLLAIGGIPDVPHDPTFVSVPINTHLNGAQPHHGSRNSRRTGGYGHRLQVHTTLPPRRSSRLCGLAVRPTSTVSGVE